jgi:hypothetical protein
MMAEARDRMVKTLAERRLCHRCSICGADALFGETRVVNGRRTAETRWFCDTHAPARAHRPANRAAAPALKISEGMGAVDLPPSPSKQGSLF